MFPLTSVTTSPHTQEQTNIREREQPPMPPRLTEWHDFPRHNGTAQGQEARQRTSPTPPPAIYGTTSRNIQQRQKKHPTRKRQTEAPKNPHPRNARVSPTRVCPKWKPLLRIRGATQTITRKTLLTKVRSRCVKVPQTFSKKNLEVLTTCIIFVVIMSFHRFGLMDLGNPPVFLYGRLFL